jgi:hypothetical protein
LLVPPFARAAGSMLPGYSVFALRNGDAAELGGARVRHDGYA